jgi:hypothetical protein
MDMRNCPPAPPARGKVNSIVLGRPYIFTMGRSMLGLMFVLLWQHFHLEPTKFETHKTSTHTSQKQYQFSLQSQLDVGSHGGS